MLPATTPKSKPSSYEHVQNSNNKIKSGEEICSSAIEKSSNQENCSNHSSQHQKVQPHGKSSLKERFKALKRKKENIRRVLHYLAQKRIMYHYVYSGESAWQRAERRANRNAKGGTSSNKRASNSTRTSMKQSTRKPMTSQTATRSRKNTTTTKIRAPTSPTTIKIPKRQTGSTHTLSTSSPHSRAANFTAG